MADRVNVTLAASAPVVRLKAGAPGVSLTAARRLQTRATAQRAVSSLATKAVAV